MEENVALDSTKQRKFAKSIKGIKKLLKKKEGKPHVPAVLAPKDSDSNEGKKKRKRPERGLVYLSHIPHGFYEHQMTEYFKQFGMVTNVRVIRSPRTGRSKGFGFVEFREPAVAEIVAETMNNYLMGKRLIKAVVIPSEKQRRAKRKHWTATHNPTAERKIKQKKFFNANKDEEGNLINAKKLLKTHEQKLKKLSNMGINYDFFKPVDVPEELLAKAQGTDEESKPIVKVGGKKKKDKKAVETMEQKKTEPEAKKGKPTEVQSKKELNKVQENANMKQNEKKRKMKDAGVTLPENFIQLPQESGDESDSSLGFDSDEYEKMLENDSEASSGDESEDDGDDEVVDEEANESSEEELPQLIPIKAKKAKKQALSPPPHPKNQKQKKPQQNEGAKKPNQNQVAKKPQAENKVVKAPQNQVAKKIPPVNQVVKQQNQGVKKAQPQPHGMKRKNTQNDVSPKKPKFEKKDNKQRKQFKKKNKAN